MKKLNLMKLSLVALSTLAVVACGSKTSDATDDGTIVEESGAQFTELTETNIGENTKVDADKLTATEENPLRIAMVTDSGTLNDHSFNESAWKGINEFAVENGGGTISKDNCVESGKIQTKYYQPAENNYDTQGRLKAMQDAAKWGAKVIVLPGYLFQSSIKLALADTTTFGDVNFLALDCTNQDTDNNYAEYAYTNQITSVIYREEQAGFLAGYAAVKEGYRKLGFCGGMAVPAVVRYGSGYCQGADAAAKELGLGNKSVEVQYYYAGQFAATPNATSYCTSWYQRGTEVIFGCGGAVYQSVIAGSQANSNKPWIGVDVNQHADTSLGASQDSCITSAMKNLANSTKVLLAGWVNNDNAWNSTLASKVVTVGAQSDNCVLPTPETTGDEGCWGFKNFTVEQYKTVLANLKAGTTHVNSNSDNEDLVAHNFSCSSRVKVNYVKD